MNITLTNDQIEVIAKAFQMATTGYEDGYEDVYPEDACAITRDTLDDFRSAAANEWREAWCVEQGEIEGRAWLYWDEMQAVSGQERSWMLVVDFGDFRAVYR